MAMFGRNRLTDTSAAAHPAAQSLQAALSELSVASANATTRDVLIAQFQSGMAAEQKAAADKDQQACIVSVRGIVLRNLQTVNRLRRENHTGQRDCLHACTVVKSERICAMKRNRQLSNICVLALAFGVSANYLCAQSPAGESAPSLCLAAEVIGGRYAVAVTCEEPVSLRRNAMVSVGSQPQAAMPEVHQAVDLPFAVPEELSPGITPKLTAETLGRLLDAYYRVNPDGAHYKILESKIGLHLVPDSFRDERGQFVPVTTLLDAIITVPQAERTPSDHLRALAEAVKRSTGIQVNGGSMDDDIYYAANGVVPTRHMLVAAYSGSGDEAAKRSFSFSWGISGVSARDALLSFLEKSATTLTWRLHCDSDTGPGKGVCWLFTHPLALMVTGPDGTLQKKTLGYDRCIQCPPLPVPIIRRQQ